MTPDNLNLTGKPAAPNTSPEASGSAPLRTWRDILLFLETHRSWRLEQHAHVMLRDGDWWWVRNRRNGQTRGCNGNAAYAAWKRLHQKCSDCGRTFAVPRDKRGRAIPLADRCSFCAEKMSM